MQVNDSSAAQIVWSNNTNRRQYMVYPGTSHHAVHLAASGGCAANEPLQKKIITLYLQISRFLWQSFKLSTTKTYISLVKKQNYKKTY